MSFEASRWALYNRWGEVLGPEHAETMTEMFADLATKSDIGAVRKDVDGLRQEVAGLKQDFKDLRAEVNERLGRLEASLYGFQKTLLVTVVTSMTALTGIFAALLTVVR